MLDGDDGKEEMLYGTDTCIVYLDAAFFLELCKPFPNKPWFLCVRSTRLLKTQWEKEKLLVTSNFSISHCVFYSFAELSVIFIKFEIVAYKLCHFGRAKNLQFGKGRLVKTESIYIFYAGAYCFTGVRLSVC